MFTITREIGVDYGHRVMTHGSKCRNVHGHRGTIEATCEGASLHAEGEQQDMVLDFGFLKEVMMEVVDEAIDHGFIGYIEDDIVMDMFCPHPEGPERDGWKKAIRLMVNQLGYVLTKDTKANSKLYAVPFIPTSERLAEHFFNRLKQPVAEMSLGKATLVNLRFWETPSCYSDFPGFTASRT